MRLAIFGAGVILPEDAVTLGRRVVRVIITTVATGAYQVLPDRVQSPKISQGDVAHFMLACLVSDAWVRRAPIIGI